MENQTLVLPIWISDRWKPLSSTARLYLLGLFGCVAALVLGVLPASRAWAGPTFLVSLSCLSFTVLREAYGWISTRFNSAPCKFAAGILAIMVAALATAAAAITINGATGQDPSYFKYSISLLAPLAFVPFLALAGFVIGLVTLPLVMLLSTGQSIFTSGKTGGLDVGILFGRMFGVIGMIAFASHVLDPSAGFEASLRRVAAHSAYQLDMHPDATCSSVPGDRVLRLNDGLVIVGRKTADGLRFVRRGCLLASEAVVLPPPKVDRDL